MSESIEILSDTTPTAAEAREAPQRWEIPALDVQARGDDLRVVIDVPGARIADVSLHVDGRALTLEAPRHDRPTLGWRRRVVLPESVDAERIAAALAHGVLTLSLPARARPMARRIPVAA